MPVKSAISATAESKSFRLKFLHIYARCTVIKTDNGYLAFIVFPKAYIERSRNNYTITDIKAYSIENACEMAAFQFKEFYAFLDVRIREIHSFNFVFSRKLFRTTIMRSIGTHTYQFVITRQFYAISENIDGVKWAKTKYWNRELISTWNALFFINYEAVFAPMNYYGFNYKIVHRLLAKYNKTKEHRLKLHIEHALEDDLIKHPERLNNHVADHREDFIIAVGLEKQRRKGL